MNGNELVHPVHSVIKHGIAMGRIGLDLQMVSGEYHKVSGKNAYSKVLSFKYSDSQKKEAKQQQFSTISYVQYIPHPSSKVVTECHPTFGMSDRASRQLEGLEDPLETEDRSFWEAYWDFLPLALPDDV